MGCAKIRIEFNRATKQTLGFHMMFFSGLPDIPHPLMVDPPGVQILRGFEADAVLFGAVEFRFDCADHRRRDFILNGEYVIQVAVIALGPDMIAGIAID